MQQEPVVKDVPETERQYSPAEFVQVKKELREFAQAHRKDLRKLAPLLVRMNKLQLKEARAILAPCHITLNQLELVRLSEMGKVPWYLHEASQGTMPASTAMIASANGVIKQIVDGNRAYHIWGNGSGCYQKRFREFSPSEWRLAYCPYKGLRSLAEQERYYRRKRKANPVMEVMLDTIEEEDEKDKTLVMHMRKKWERAGTHSVKLRIGFQEMIKCGFPVASFMEFLGKGVAKK